MAGARLPTRTKDQEMESPLRSLTKAVTWQLIGLITMTTLAFIATGDLASAGGLALGAAITSFFFFFLHERVWALIPWGRRSIPFAKREPF